LDWGIFSVQWIGSWECNSNTVNKIRSRNLAQQTHAGRGADRHHMQQARKWKIHRERERESPGYARADRRNDWLFLKHYLKHQKGPGKPKGTGLLVSVTLILPWLPRNPPPFG
jgi:hypothetical protein